MCVAYQIKDWCLFFQTRVYKIQCVINIRYIFGKNKHNYVSFTIVKSVNIGKLQRMRSGCPNFSTQHCTELSILIGYTKSGSHTSMENVNKPKKMEPSAKTFANIFKKLNGNIIGMIHILATPGWQRSKLCIYQSIGVIYFICHRLFTESSVHNQS